MSSPQPAIIPCYICHAPVPNIDGPVSSQKYLPQSPGCWKLYTDVLAREYGEWQYPDIHRLTVDCYAAQHPTPQPDPTSAQSVSVHLAGIYLHLTHQLPSTRITHIIGQLTQERKSRFDWLTPPADLGRITIADVQQAQDLSRHQELVTAWAAAIWQAWSEHHSVIANMAEESMR